MNPPRWLKWAQNLQALAQSGLTYTENPFDRERYKAIREITVEMLADGSGYETEQVRDLIDSQAGYMTPKIDVRGVVFRENRILLVKELSDGRWTLPGGWVDVNEPPSQAVEREVWEESGYRVKTDKLLALYDRNLHGHPAYIFHIYKLYFLCHMVGGEPSNSIETGGADFFSEDQLPPLSIARTTPQVLERMFYHFRNPNLATDFD